MTALSWPYEITMHPKSRIGQHMQSAIVPELTVHPQQYKPEGQRIAICFVMILNCALEQVIIGQVNGPDCLTQPETRCTYHGNNKG